MKDLNGLQCGRQPDPKDCYLSSLNMTVEDQIALTIARYFFHSFALPQSNAWITALAEAEARFGYHEGPVIAARVLALLQVIRRARRSVFMFNSPTCPGCAAIATEHERRLMTALSAHRRGDVGTARLEVMMLCEGNHVDNVLCGLAYLGKALDGDLPKSPRRTSMSRSLQ